jgi:redox-sensitive bicupin YhaK (pirin superfamily)
MLTIRRAGERGAANHGWLQSRHSFSFGDYHDPKHMGFRGLRVINDDRVQPAMGFPTHSHRDMEIVSYVLEGALAHKDSTGNSGVIRPGDVQAMSAGTGIAHSEFNASDKEPVHFLQLWMLPSEQNLVPTYEQKTFADSEKRGRFRLIASPDGAENSVTIHTDIRLYAGLFDCGEHAVFQLKSGRFAWVHVARGAAMFNEQSLEQGDGVAIDGEMEIAVTGARGSEILLFDLA